MLIETYSIVYGVPFASHTLSLLSCRRRPKLLAHTALLAGGSPHPENPTQRSPLGDGGDRDTPHTFYSPQQPTKQANLHIYYM